MSSNPPPLPAGWTSEIDQLSGRRYYANRITGESSWEVPLPLPLAPPPPPPPPLSLPTTTTPPKRPPPQSSGSSPSRFRPQNSMHHQQTQQKQLTSRSAKMERKRASYQGVVCGKHEGQIKLSKPGLVFESARVDEFGDPSLTLKIRWADLQEYKLNKRSSPKALLKLIYARGPDEAIVAMFHLPDRHSLELLRDDIEGRVTKKEKPIGDSTAISSSAENADTQDKHGPGTFEKTESRTPKQSATTPAPPTENAYKQGKRGTLERKEPWTPNESAASPAAYTHNRLEFDTPDGSGLLSSCE